MDTKNIFEEVLHAVSTSENPDQSLDAIVRLVADRFKVDVCSVYMYEPYGNDLILKATKGLSKASVGTIEMDIHEGLTGLVIETTAPVFIVNPAAHPRYKYYEGSGEEVYKTYLGLPLIYHQKVLGALVVQTLAEDGISESQIDIFKNIAGQIAATVAYTRVLKDRRAFGPRRASGSRRPDKAHAASKLKDNHLKGEGVSDYAGDGYARFMFDSIEFDQVQICGTDDPKGEVERLNQAFEKAADQIKTIFGEVHGLSKQDKAIVNAHLMLVGDKSLRKKIVSRIKENICAESALKQVINNYVDMFEAINDPYLSERSSDVKDIGRRVLINLKGGNGDPDTALTRDTIIIANDLSPVDLLAIRQPHLKGIVLSKGGKTSHTAIIARSLEIPIVIGVDGLLEKVRENDFLIIDGVSGYVYVNPDTGIRKEYSKRKQENEQALKQLESIRDLPAVTTDAFSVRLGANIGLLSDIMQAKKYGADLIGLYRTEFPFLLRKSFPPEEEQVSLYRRVLEKSEGRSVTIRTFDVGGDKFLPYLDYPKEDNPFLGWRSIRLSLDLEDVFRTQIRAILRASAFGNAKILFPMITSIDEIRKVVDLVNDEKQNLARKNIGYDRNIELGVMVEVPAAVTILDRLLRYADFVNIGSNDLVQYLLAVDRNNKKVAANFDALHPAVITVICDIIRICRQFDKHVCICGEAGRIKECLFLFIGMGADDISMTPSAIPAAKQFIRGIRLSDARQVLEACLTMEDAGQIRGHVADFLAGLI
ncbi:MAG: phosphoenolpyruvate--protein phosphotransferase [Desulfobacteraceae bacterium]|nr:MAG: phosphoenolpyruvate--protein phosphotransferase [Desulfobacteraceae bacterium]